MKQLVAGDTVYLAGPMSGIEKLNFPEFFRVEAILARAGLTVVSPARHDIESGVSADAPEQQTEDFRERMLAWDFDQIINRVTGVVLLAGWHNSKGARAEAMLAQMIGKPVFLIVESEGQLALAPLSITVESYVAAGAPWISRK